MRRLKKKQQEGKKARATQNRNRGKKKQKEERENALARFSKAGNEGPVKKSGGTAC